MFDRTYKLQDDIVSRTNPNGTIVLMRMDDSEVFYKINGIAAQIWSGIEEGKIVSELIQEITQEYECTQDQIESDTKSFIEELLEKNILI